MKTHRVGNRIRRAFIETLLTVFEGGLHRQLGSPSITEYAQRHFRYRASQTREFLRVARLLPELPALRRAFDEGEIHWSDLREITRVARAGSEAEWLDFARSHSAREVRAEVRQALRQGRKGPRKGRWGLPDLPTRVSFELGAEELDILQKALEKTARELGEVLRGEGGAEGGGDEGPGARRVEPKDALILLARRALETDPAATGEGRVEREDSPFTVLYDRCPDCRRVALLTPEGPVEVDPAGLERVEGEAEAVVAEAKPEPGAGPEDAPAAAATGREKRTDAAIARRVRLRTAGVCANPCCGRPAEHAHHVRSWADGGPTTYENEVALCALCHGAIHQGLLAIEGSLATGFRFAAVADRLRPDIGAELRLLASLGIDDAPPRPSSGSAETSTRLEVRPSSGSADEARVRAVASGLEGLGCRRTDARERTRRAWEALSGRLGRPPSEEELLQAALRGPSPCGMLPIS